MLRVAALSVAEMRRVLRQPGDVSDLLVRSAITLAAGPGLLEAAEGSGSAPDRLRARDAVRRYITRMGGRATPFGLLAGICVPELGTRTTLRITGRADYRVSASPDIAVLETIVGEHISSLPSRQVPLRVNPTLVRIGNHFSCRKPESPLDVVRAKTTQAISLALACCDSPCTAEELAGRLRTRLTTISDEKIKMFVDELVDHGVFTPDTGLVCHGRTPAQVAATLLVGTGGGARAGSLTSAASAVGIPQPLTAGFLARMDDSWQELGRSGRGLDGVRAGGRYDVQLSVTCQGTLDRTVLRDLRRAADRVAQFFPPPDQLAELRTRFEDRYEDATVPVLEVADAEYGLMPWPARSRSAIADRADSTARANVPADPPSGSAQRDVSQVQLLALDHWLRTGSPPDLAKLAPPDAQVTGRPPRQYQATGTIAALIRDPARAVHSVLSVAGLAGSGAVFGRLALSSPGLAEHVRAEVAGWRQSAGEHAITAEVLYSPGGRPGNVLLRPRVCDEAIALSGATGGTIHPGRLVMRLENGQFAVYDQQTGARVRLCVNSAYRASLPGNDPLYILLATLADSNRGVRWQWQALSAIRHLPRVVCGPVVITPERWVVSSEDMATCAGAADPARLLRSFLPGIGPRRWIGALEGDGDQILPVDLGDPQFPGVLDYILKRAITEFVELPHVEHPYVRGPGGYHVAEISAAFSRVPPARDTAGDSRPISRPLAREDWSYLQLFCGFSAADSVVLRAHALACALRADGLARQWFFVRYDEDGHHVRVRICASGGQSRAAVTSALMELTTALRGEGLVTSVRQLLYVPEGRRYGGPCAMGAAESLFSTDSDWVAGFLGSGPSEVQRLAAASATIRSWWRHAWQVRAMGTQEDLHRAMREAQRRLWPGPRWPSKGVGRIWRACHADVEREIRSAAASPHGEPEISALLSRMPPGCADMHLREVIASAAHMHCNRLFACDPRRMEALAYEFAAREMRRAAAVPTRPSRPLDAPR